MSNSLLNFLAIFIAYFLRFLIICSFVKQMKFVKLLKAEVQICFISFYDIKEAASKLWVDGPFLLDLVHLFIT